MYGNYKNTLIAKGYIPLPQNGHVPAVDNFISSDFTPPDGFSKHNIGIVCGNGENPICAVDIDIVDETLSEKIKNAAFNVLGSSPKRIGSAPKMLLIYRADKEGIRKKTSDTYLIHDVKCKVEILGYGQVFTALGIHPKTQKPYIWKNGNIIHIAAASLTEITETKLNTFLDLCDTLLFNSKFKKYRKETKLEHSDYDPNDPLDHKPKVGKTIDEIKELLKPLDPDCDRDQWRNIGLSVHHETEGNEEGFQIWDDWSSGGSKYNEREMERQWESFGKYPGEPLTLAYVIKLNKEADELDPTIEKPVKKIWSISELQYKDIHTIAPPPTEFVIPNLLAKGIVGFLYGQGGSFKSLAALWLVIQRAIADVLPGQRWLDTFALTQGKSIMFSAEDCEIDFHQRSYDIFQEIIGRSFDDATDDVLNALTENRLLVPREQWIDDKITYIVKENGQFTKKVTAIIDITNRFGADLIILETTSRIAEIDENDNRKAAAFVSCLEYIRDKTGATVIAISHSSKLNRSAQTDTFGQNSMRGAGAFIDNARFGMWFKPVKRDDERQDIIEVICSKTFRCRRADTISLVTKYPTFYKHSEISLADKVIQDVYENPGTKQGETRRRLKKGTKAISDAFADAIEREQIYLKGPKNRPEGYFYTEEENDLI